MILGLMVDLSKKLFGGSTSETPFEKKNCFLKLFLKGIQDLNEDLNPVKTVDHYLDDRIDCG